MCAVQQRKKLQEAFDAVKAANDAATVEVEGLMAPRGGAVFQEALREELATIKEDLSRVMREAEEKIVAIINSGSKCVEKAAAVEADDKSRNSSDLELDKQLHAHAQPRDEKKEGMTDEARIASSKKLSRML